MNQKLEKRLEKIVEEYEGDQNPPEYVSEIIELLSYAKNS